MKFPRILALTAAVLGISMSIHAQTITGVLDPSAMSPFPGIGEGVFCSRVANVCNNIPIVFADGTYENIWLSQQGSGGFIYFTVDPLGLQGYTPGWNFYGAHLTAGPPNRTFFGTTSYGRPYTGVFTMTERSYDSSGGGGRTGGAGLRWVITSATLTITFGGTASPDSPIAPTPVCLPGDKGGCPPKDL